MMTWLHHGQTVAKAKQPDRSASTGIMLLLVLLRIGCGQPWRLTNYGMEYCTEYKRHDWHSQLWGSGVATFNNSQHTSSRQPIPSQ
ncbi:hypothetical protein BDW72DRAFT_151456 [Aspergillus terricola var. indicus]